MSIQPFLCYKQRCLSDKHNAELNVYPQNNWRFEPVGSKQIPMNLFILRSNDQYILRSNDQ
ncbi:MULTISPECIES: tat protein [Yersinia pseudotuberculosis complex]|uniref:tat protein n=1 Tax=Yersinia pseudotuberculosis complex TaxID=1649845 RepID=UPI0028C4E907|nr:MULTISPECIES: tat protein [Yersinia pseudotuberculosis complex]